jgi:type VI protein secretion system component Hcp
VAGLVGQATEPQHAGAIVLTSIAPASMLPPTVGTVPLTELTVLRDVDQSSPALVQAMAGGTHFDCVQVEMGPSRWYLYATYAFHDAQFDGYAPTGSTQSIEQLTLSYVTVDWEYQLRDGTSVVTGSGTLGSTPNPRSLAAASVSRAPVTLLLAFIALTVLLAGATGGLWRLRRRRRRP